MERAEKVLEACEGRCAIQLRAHKLAAAEFFGLAERLRGLVEANDAQLWINDRVDVALGLRADGVQLGSRGIPPESARELLGSRCWLGYSAHSPDEAEASFDSGADLVILGSIYPTATHPGGEPLGVEALRIAAGRGRPIVAIGGITLDKIGELVEAGAWGVAIKSGIWDAAVLDETARGYLEAVESAVQRASRE